MMEPIDVMVRAALRAGRGLLEDFARVRELRVIEKRASDFVSNADLRAQDTVFAELSPAFPGATFVMEEDAASHAQSGREAFHVDPLDGTTNFLHRVPHFAVSIAYEVDSELSAGVVFDPAKNELFVATSGGGAHLGEERLSVTREDKLEHALIGSGVPFRGRGNHARYFSVLPRVMSEVAGLRRFGSAALDLAYVAAGRFDAFFETDLSTWDIAAGVLLVREAGGQVTRTSGAPFELRLGDVLASNGALHGALGERLRGLT